MKERVTVRLGQGNVLLVCPHGHPLDDTNTDVLTETTANLLHCGAVINRGFRRAASVDSVASMANCNDARHCTDPVVQQEFMNPISTALLDIFQSGEHCLVFLIHGMGNAIRKQANEPKLDAVVGFGNGKPPRLTCETWRKDLLVDALNADGTLTFEGAPGGPFSARGSNNLAQALRQHGVDTFQIETVYARRETAAAAILMATSLARAITAVALATTYSRPANMLVREI